MITVRLVGGLGNQLFQWACGRNLQRLYGHELQYDDHIALSNREADLYRFPSLVLNKREHTKKPRQGLYKSVSINDSFNYEEFKKVDFSNPGDNFYLNGYWQGVAYFKECATEIREELSPDKDFFSNNIIAPGSVSLHVRRTDYLNLQNFHPIQPIAYYEKALEILNHSGPIYVFSDDIEWCEQTLKFPNTQFIKIKNTILEIWLMSLCSNNIIANSTFSWWGAWLNNNPNKRVICPKHWFGPSAPYSDKDILDNDWIKI